MAEYYYFASTLPMLTMGKELPITYAEFMEKAREQLSRKDYRDLEKAVFSSSSDSAGSSIVREWQEYSEKISRMMNAVRAEKLGFDGYNDDKTDDWPRGKPNVMIARAIESGTSWSDKHPFFNKALQASRKRAEERMKEVMEREIQTAMEG